MRMLYTAPLWLASLLLAACATAVDEQAVGQAETHRRIAEIKLDKGETEFAIREYKFALEEHEPDPETHFGIAQAYRRKGLYQDAERHLLRAVELDPRHQEAKLNLSVLYLHQKRWADAIALSRVLADDPTFLRPERALVNLGWAQYNSGDLAGAEGSYTQALRADPANYVAHLDMGILRYDRGETVEAIRHFEKVLEIIEPIPDKVVAGTEAQTRFRLAQAHVRLGHREKAIEQLEKAAEQGGRGHWGEKSREYLAVLK